MVEDLALARLGLGDQGVVKDVENILADLLELGLDLLAVVTDDGNVLVGTLLLLLLLDRGDDAPRGTSGTDNVLVGDGEEVTLVDGKFTTDLILVVSGWESRRLDRVGITLATSCYSELMVSKAESMIKVVHVRTFM